MQRESGNEGLRQAANRQPGDPAGEPFFGVAPAVKRGACGFSEGLVADGAFEAPFYLPMNSEVALWYSAAGRASQIRRKYAPRVQAEVCTAGEVSFYFSSSSFLLRPQDSFIASMPGMNFSSSCGAEALISNNPRNRRSNSSLVFR
jgi:hypothetical protein